MLHDIFLNHNQWYLSWQGAVDFTFYIADSHYQLQDCIMIVDLCGYQSKCYLEILQ